LQNDVYTKVQQHSMEELTLPWPNQTCHLRY